MESPAMLKTSSKVLKLHLKNAFSENLAGATLDADKQDFASDFIQTIFIITFWTFVFDPCFT